jgi:hypothetical protein
MKSTRIVVGDVAEFRTGPGNVMLSVINRGTHVEVRATDDSIIPNLTVDIHPPNQVYVSAFDPDKIGDE